MKHENAGTFRNITSNWLDTLRSSDNIDTVRSSLLAYINYRQFETYSETSPDIHDLDRVIVRDCARAWRGILNPRSEKLSGFSVLSAMIDAAHGIDDPDLSDAFWTDICRLVEGIEGRFIMHENTPFSFRNHDNLKGRDAAEARSRELDLLSSYMEDRMSNYPSGLSDGFIRKRASLKRTILRALHATAADWNDWRWHLRHIAKTSKTLGSIARLSPDEVGRINRCTKGNIPFGVTPYYAALFDDSANSRSDTAIRAQVLFPDTYLDLFTGKDNPEYAHDFMLESDTSPVDLITRRYAEIVIFKPYNACPQVCVYCQRNWEIKGPMASGAMADRTRIARAIGWIADHDAIKEVLVTGGDPMVLSDGRLRQILDGLSSIGHIERIRIGTRTPVTLPMRFTADLCRLLGSYRVPGRREISVITHIQSPMELTPDFVRAVERLRKQGISVYNQLVYTVFISRRFEASHLRRLIRLCGVDPYYSFYPKGKAETIDYRVPIARMLQEQKEESRLMPGLARTDEPVYNVPGLGKNNLNSWQHRDIISISPCGSRIYEFHPWEKKIADQKTHVGMDVPILDYMERLEQYGENPDDYGSIWYYF